MARKRQNFITGTVADTPNLGSAATSLNSAGLANLQVISGADVAVLVLDPQGANGAPEIVYVTAHTSSATVATISRAQEGTTNRLHPTGTRWVHAMTINDPAFLDTSQTWTAVQTFNTVGINNVSWQDNDNHSLEGDGLGGWRFRNAWATANARFRFYGGSSTVELVRIDDNGVSAIGTNSKFGTGALGASGTYVRIGDQSDTTAVYVIADGSGSDVGLVLRSKGVNEIAMQDGTGATNLLRMKTVSAVPYLGFYGTAPVAQPTVTGSRGGNAALASLLTSLQTMGLIVNSSSP